MRSLLTAIVLLVLLASEARANWEYTKWGMTPNQVVRASRGSVEVVPKAARYRDDVEHWEIAARGTFVSGSLTLDVEFTFNLKNRGLRCVLYNATGDQVPVLKDKMLKANGPPAKESNAGGATKLVWNTPDKISLVMARNDGTAVLTHCAP